MLVNLDPSADPTKQNRTGLTLMINPTSTPVEGAGTTRGIESCFSCGPLAGLVERPKSIKIKWFDEGAVLQEARVQGFGSVITGHETDHLNGILFPDRVLEQGGEIAWVQAEQAAAGEYGKTVRAGETWGTNCPPDQWEAMKRQNGSDKPLFRLDAFTLPE